MKPRSFIRRLVAAACAAGLALVAADHCTAGGLRVAVSIQPQLYFLEQLGGDLVAGMVMVEPGADMHTYEPKPAQMRALAGTRLYFAIGADFERVWLDKIAAAHTAMRIVRTDKHVPKTAMVSHRHHEEERDNHRGERLDPHIWLSPPLVRIVAETMRDALVAADPVNARQYRLKYCRFAQQINRCDTQILRLCRDAAGTGENRFMVYHPAWGYFARTYGLQQIPIELEGKSPGPRQLAGIISRARRNKVKVVFVQPQVSDRNAQTIAREIGGVVVRADPLAYEWADNLLSVARAVVAAQQ